jgi:hypothetical protein
LPVVVAAVGVEVALAASELALRLFLLERFTP